MSGGWGLRPNRFKKVRRRRYLLFYMEKMMSRIFVEDLEIVHETEPGSLNAGALLVTNGDVKVWLPKQALDWPAKSGPGDLVDIEMPESLAIEKELV